MKLTDAAIQLDKRLQRTTNKSERKVYQTLLGVISNLGERELTAKEQESIEKAMEGLNLGGGEGTSLRMLKRSRNRFMKFLKDEHCLTPQGHYTESGMSIGLLAGTALAPLIEKSVGMSMGLSLGISLGMLGGLIVGWRMDKDAEKQNRIIKTR